MDKEQVFEIPITSPLEPSLEEAIVNVQQPTFSHNPQSPVSGFLSNAIKYEGDGIFADWFRYYYRMLYNHLITFDINELDPANELVPLEEVYNIKFPQVMRNFYFYEDIRYALDLQFPWTTHLKNLGFTVGFGDVVQNESKGIQLQLQRIADGDDIVAYIKLNLWLDPFLDIGELRDPRYIITGKTYKYGYDFRLLADPYKRLMDLPDERSDNAPIFLEDTEWLSFIPNDYEAFMTFGRDTIAASIVRKIHDQNNLVVVFPLVVESNVANDLSITKLVKDNGITTFGFGNSPKRFFNIHDDHSFSQGDIGDDLNLTLVHDGHAVFYPDTVNEYDQFNVQNTATIYPDPNRPMPALAGMSDILVECGEAVIAVAEGSVISSPTNNSMLSIYTISVTEALRSINIDENRLIVTEVNLTHGTSGRPESITPNYWLGEIQPDVSVGGYVGFTFTLKAGMTTSNVPVIISQQANFSGTSDSDLMQKINAFVVQLNAQFLQVTRIQLLGNFTATVTWNQSSFETIQQDTTQNVLVVCNNPESGDWSAIPLETDDGFPLTVRNSIVMNDDNMSGTIKVDLLQVKQSSRSAEYGIVFSFAAIKTKYIKNVTWAATGKNILSMIQGDEIIKASLSVDDWDFTDTLLEADGVSLPTVYNKSNTNRQNITVEYQGLDDTEVLRLRYTVDLPSIHEYIGVVPVPRYSPLRIGSDPVNETPSTSYPESIFNMSGTFIPSTVDGSNRWGAIVEPVFDQAGKYRLQGLSDDTIRTIKIRRLFMLAQPTWISDLNMTNMVQYYNLISASGLATVMDLVFQDNRSDQFIIHWDNGSYIFNQVSDEIEVGAVTDYIRQVGEGNSDEQVLLDQIALAEINQDDVLSEQLQRQLDDLYASNSFNMSINGSVNRFLFRDSDKGIVTFLPKGIYKRDDPNITYIDHTVDTDKISVDFEYIPRDDDKIHRTDISVDFDGEAYIGCTAYDLRTGTAKDLQLASPKDDYAILTTQFEADASTETFWYIDSEHILQLTTDSLILLEREELGARSPKDGGYWSAIATRPRGYMTDDYPVLIFGDRSDGYKYGVSCAVEERPYMYRVQPTATGIVIYFVLTRITDLQFEKAGGGNPSWGYCNINFSNLGDTGFSTRTLAFVNQPPTPSFFVNNIRLSASYVQGSLLVGMQFDKGIHQWTITINPSTNNNYSIFNGYGCVGIDGTVTGGAVPAYAMNTQSGNRVPVRSKPDTTAALSSKRQAFISGQSLCFLDDIFAGGVCVNAKYLGNNKFRLNNLPLTFSRSNVSESKAATSIDLAVKGDFVFPNPLIIFLATAWVWARASSAIAMNYWSVNALTEDEDFYSDDQSISVSAGAINNTLFRVALALMSAVATTASVAADKVHNVVDRLINETSKQDLKDAFGGTRDGETDAQAQERRNNAWKSNAKRVWDEPQKTDADFEDARKLGKPVFGDKKYYKDKVSSGLVAAINAFNSGISSQPTAIAVAKCRLGMSGIYSVSANQNVFAGPGFVQIQFVQGARISGSYSNSHAAQGGGSMLGIRIPPLPIPFVGPLDLNNTGLVGVQPYSGVNSYDIKMEFQPNVNIGSKHLVYSYPTQEVHSHTINQTLLTPVLIPETIELYRDSTYSMTKSYERRLLKYAHMTKSSSFYDNCSLVQGVDSFYDTDDVLDIPIKVDSGYPVFSEPGMFDFCVYPSAELFFSAIAGEIIGVSVRDTLLIDGAPSNIVINANLPLVACSYACVEVRNDITDDTLFPRVFSGDTVLFNLTGYNTIKKLTTYHGFDGYTNRIARLTGEVGLDAEVQNSLYSHVKQDSFKTAALPPPTSYFGKFAQVPEFDPYLHQVEINAKFLGNLGVSSENLNGYRYSIPIVHNNIALLPAAVQMIASYKAFVIEGITSLTSDLRTTNSKNKKPIAHDFMIYGQLYRANDEYISRLNPALGAIAVQDVVATLGLTYLGSTPKVAWFYSPTLHMFCMFTGSDTLERVSTAYRFKDVEDGTWDFVSQEVAFRTMMEHGLSLVRVDRSFLGQIYHPNENVTWSKDTPDNFKYYGLSSGLALQGPRRGQINRFVLQDNMLRDTDGIVFNARTTNDINHFWHWLKPEAQSIDDFWLERQYDYTDQRINPIEGYFIEPFKLATSFLGVDENNECQFEWEISFALTELMKKILQDRYVVVNFASEMQTVGGIKRSEVTHLYLKEDSFTRKEGTSGYYNFRFNGRNGAGSSEKLYIWSDGIVSIRQIKLHTSVISAAKTAPLITRPDVADRLEM